jgi:hypothetical protein
MRFSIHQCSWIASLLLAVFSTSCGLGGPAVPPKKADQVLYQWNDDGGSGKVAIRISLPDQIAEIERGGRDIGWCYVATGKEGHGTSPGSYRVMEKIEDKHSNRYGWIEDEFGNVVDGDAKPGDRVPEGMAYMPSPMPYWMRITSYGIGMHSGLIPEPGKPASHGCIRMPKAFAPILYDAVEVGTPVTVTNEKSKRSRISESPELRDFEGESRVISSRRLSPSEAAVRKPVSNTPAPSALPVY